MKPNVTKLEHFQSKGWIVAPSATPFFNSTGFMHVIFKSVLLYISRCRLRCSHFIIAHSCVAGPQAPERQWMCAGLAAGNHKRTTVTIAPMNWPESGWCLSHQELVLLHLAQIASLLACHTPLHWARLCKINPSDMVCWAYSLFS